MSRIVCLMAQMMLSMNSLNCGGGMVKSAKRMVRDVKIRVWTEKRTREAVQVDRAEKLEEANAMFWELCKVLVDHVERRLEHSVQDGGHLWSQQRLRKILLLHLAVYGHRTTHP